MTEGERFATPCRGLVGSCMGQSSRTGYAKVTCLTARTGARNYKVSWLKGFFTKKLDAKYAHCIYQEVVD